MKYKSVLFDMDGVLIDSESYYCEGTYIWMKELGYTGEESAIYTMIGTTMEVTYQILAKLLNNAYTTSQLKVVNEDYFRRFPLPYAKIMKKSIPQLLQGLKAKGIKTAVCSSSPLATIEKVLEECQISSYFDYIVSGEQFVESKPNPEIYLHAANVLSNNPDECIVIEDSTLGIQAGKNAGMRVIALHDKKFSLDQSDASTIVDSIEDVAKLLEINVL